MRVRIAIEGSRNQPKHDEKSLGFLRRDAYFTDPEVSPFTM